MPQRAGTPAPFAGPPFASPPFPPVLPLVGAWISASQLAPANAEVSRQK